MKIRNLILVLVIVFGIASLLQAQIQKIEWEFGSEKGKGTATATLTGYTFNEVWTTIMDVLFFEKFKPRGSAFKVMHETIELDKDTGLISVQGFMAGYSKYALRVMIIKKDGHLAMKVRCTSTWKKRVIEKLFELLEEGLKGED